MNGDYSLSRPAGLGAHARLLSYRVELEDDGIADTARSLRNARTLLEVWGLPEFLDVGRDRLGRCVIVATWPRGVGQRWAFRGFPWDTDPSGEKGEAVEGLDKFLEWLGVTRQALEHTGAFGLRPSVDIVQATSADPRRPYQDQGIVRLVCGADRDFWGRHGKPAFEYV